MCVCVVSHFMTSIQGKIGVLLAMICRYDRQMLGNTSSSSALTSGSLCGIYSGYSSWLILLKLSPQCGSAILDHVLASVSPKYGGWMKTFFVVVLMTGFGLGVYSNCFVAPGEGLRLPLVPLTLVPSAIIWWSDFLAPLFLQLK
jgi:hypothetical protein